MDQESPSNVAGPSRLAYALDMALSATLHRFQVELSDVDRGVYQTLDFRVAQHPSEDGPRMLTRVLAYLLLFEEGIDFGRGLSNTEEPALATTDLTGRLVHWIDVGAPSGTRLHAASKKADRTSVVCHKGLEALRGSIGNQAVHGAEKLEILLLEPALLDELSAHLDRNARWTVVHFDGTLTITSGDETVTGKVDKTTLARLLESGD